MTEQLPTIESLDEAARAIGRESWAAAMNCHPLVCSSIIAHARTLDKLHDRTPVDPDVEALERVLGKWHDANVEWRNAMLFPAALAQYKAEKAKWEGRE